MNKKKCHAKSCADFIRHKLVNKGVMVCGHDLVCYQGMILCKKCGKCIYMFDYGQSDKIKHANMKCLTDNYYGRCGK